MRDKLMITGLGLSLVIAVFLVSCNNSDESENNSTRVDYNNRDTSTGSQTDTGVNTTLPVVNDSPGSTTSRPTSTAKRKGRVTVTAATKPAKPAVIKADDQGYYDYTESAPAFTGGRTALENYVNSRIEYPEEAINSNIQGTVYVQFAIDENGKVSNATTTGDKLGYGLEEAALKAVNSMPNWTPGQVKGKNVKARYTLPITFKLEE